MDAIVCFFFFNDTATTEIYTLSLHDALPISHDQHLARVEQRRGVRETRCRHRAGRDRKSTRLNSSHVEISYAVFCLKKKKKKKINYTTNYHNTSRNGHEPDGTHEAATTRTQC